MTRDMLQNQHRWIGEAREHVANLIAASKEYQESVSTMVSPAKSKGSPIIKKGVSADKEFESIPTYANSATLINQMTPDDLEISQV